MTDVGFIIAGYGVILGGIGLYAVLLARRLRAAGDAVSRASDAEPPSDDRPA